MDVNDSTEYSKLGDSNHPDITRQKKNKNKGELLTKSLEPPSQTGTDSTIFAPDNYFY